MKPSDFVCYMQVNKDDFFLFETCRRIMEEGVIQLAFHVPIINWDGTEQNPAELSGIVKTIMKLRGDGATTTCDFSSWRKTKDESRIQIETRLRNTCLSVMRQRGHQHILVVDGDELWKRGTLAKVIEKVEQGSTCIATKMTSVIGLPGYPVEGGKQDAIIYYGGDRQIRECRHPVGDYDRIEGENIFHFTCTRRTTNEIISKLRGSAHYGQEGYDFNKFIQETLPNIKPGLRNSHTWWQDGSNWPLVREWTEQELGQIPPCYYPYLGTIQT